MKTYLLPVALLLATVSVSAETHQLGQVPDAASWRVLILPGKGPVGWCPEGRALFVKNQEYQQISARFSSPDTPNRVPVYCLEAGRVEDAEKGTSHVIYRAVAQEPFSLVFSYGPRLRRAGPPPEELQVQPGVTSAAEMARFSAPPPPAGPGERRATSEELQAYRLAQHRLAMGSRAVGDPDAFFDFSPRRESAEVVVPGVSPKKVPLPVPNPRRAVKPRKAPVETVPPPDITDPQVIAARAHAISKLGASPRIADLVIRAATAAGVDPLLALSIVYRESTFKERAHNKRSGAAGLFQLMKATGEDMRIAAAERFDAARNALGGMRYLNWLNRHYAKAPGLSDFSKMTQRGMDRLLIGWHAGPGNLMKNRVGPATREFMKKVGETYRTLRGLAPAAAADAALV